MSNYAIRAEGLGKRYRLGNGERYLALRDSVAGTLRGATRVFSKKGHDGQAERASLPGQTIWAVRDLSFEIGAGEVVGVIGRNGAGKTTLLKLLSRITEPTRGRAEIRGRVGSLLEVGTGFHPELTGRENVYFNGSVLGMRKAEIDRHFDEIVSFAGVERFIDTPVKRYSSGMQLRLAFAVAAHLEPEVLLIDEVLAVGDRAFQEKSLGKVGEVTRSGRTVIFVSHNMQAVSRFCSRVFWMDEGGLRCEGPTRQVVEAYLAAGAGNQGERTWGTGRAPQTEFVRLDAVRVRGEDDRVATEIDLGCAVEFELEFSVLKRTPLTPSLHIFNAEGIALFSTSGFSQELWQSHDLATGHYRYVCKVPAHLLNQGRHYVTIYLTRHNNHGIPEVHVPEVVAFEMIESSPGYRGDYLGRWIGVIRPVLDWKAERIEAPVTRAIDHTPAPESRGQG